MKSIHYFKNGQVSASCNYVNGKKEGFAEFYIKSGALSHKLHYVDGLLDGIQHFFYPDGALKMEIGYAKGRFQGKIMLYYPHGGLKREVHVEEGKRHGLDSQWDETGHPTFILEYVRGEFLKAPLEDQTAKFSHLPLPKKMQM